ncbi:MAG: 50S ribosomal protein L23 [Candidatus Kerfeldbacteria bacterium]|nr:50S ribosomal protein L23 [Candidatus Kerfeldbacteria bacterium]
MSIFNRKEKTAAAPKATKAAGEKKANAKSVVTSAAKIVGSRTLLRPVITEKNTLNGTYAFQVAPTANKNEIMKAVESLYGVAPVSVRIINVIGKTVRSAKTGEGKRRDWKKAIVRFEAGKTINVYEGI